MEGVGKVTHGSGFLRGSRVFQTQVKIGGTLHGHPLVEGILGWVVGGRVGGTQDPEFRVAHGSVYQRGEISCLVALSHSCNSSVVVDMQEGMSILLSIVLELNC